MRRITVPLLFAIAATAAAQSNPSSSVDVTAPPAPPEAIVAPARDPSALVKAAHESKAKKKTSKRKVITNADVKKSKAKLLNSTAPAMTATPAPQRSIIAEADAQKRARVAAEQRVDSAEHDLAVLQADLARIEQSYYDENDPERRDGVIRQQFEEKKQQVEVARQKLAEARDALVAVAERIR